MSFNQITIKCKKCGREYNDNQDWMVKEIPCKTCGHFDFEEISDGWNAKPEEIEYSKQDHFHCWKSKNPPCGQKIKHFECCLCKELNPEIKKLDKEISKRIIKVIDKI